MRRLRDCARSVTSCASPMWRSRPVSCPCNFPRWAPISCWAVASSGCVAAPAPVTCGFVHRSSRNWSRSTWAGFRTKILRDGHSLVPIRARRAAFLGRHALDRAVRVRRRQPAAHSRAGRREDSRAQSAPDQRVPGHARPPWRARLPAWPIGGTLCIPLGSEFDAVTGALDALGAQYDCRGDVIRVSFHACNTEDDAMIVARAWQGDH